MTGTSTAQHVKILFRLEQDEDGYPPVSAETLWAITMDENLYKLDNIPFFATGIAVEDVVRAELEAGQLLYKEVVHPSGHSTFRVVVYNHDEVPEVRETFKQLGCLTEQSHLRGLIAIDVPPSVSWDELKRVLNTGREQDRWDYEEACLARS
ncbi:hypothetical protein D187_003752 [Cystobacter fuscus DSM 2262]|uniref:DUF4265 domain-containing protein n=1 Tax=Cystobacter fuscus (strain ATCC 25194 / DSM 2262 / NBRC 100088 / M29) TaxID=1242864 RepID=S9QB62_CYSF2|nr:DUF4265 domain-containing protein [Cystobacter fuscus]EPX58554.1 hypothetical protein D187_003752 [Cystobacter fuscus DSM 2262]